MIASIALMLAASAHSVQAHPLQVQAFQARPLQATHGPVVGRWSNPKGTLAVETHPCPGDTLCGTIVWASA
ncbi:hypothetical protein ACTGZS_12215, partial [Streptococcus suis]